MAKLFSVPIASGGIFECSSLSQNVYLLSFEAPPDNRVVSDFCESFLLALNILENRYPHGVLITTSAIPKFYSNGFILQHNAETPRFMENFCLPLIKKLLVYPMPTIALINGHCFGAGVFLAIAHDYRIQNPSKGFLCLPEIDLGAVIPSPFQQMFKQKLPSPAVFRLMALEGKRIPGKDAFEMGVVDGLGGLEDVVRFVETKKLIAKVETGVWGSLKEDMYRETLATMDEEGYHGSLMWREEIEKRKFEEKEDALKKIEKLERSQAKL